MAALAVAAAAVIGLLLLALFALWRRLAAADRQVQRQRRELSHASRLAIVGELTAAIAHEINQPLGAILSNADAAEILLDAAEPPLPEIRRIVADIRRDGLRASDVIRNVRTLVRRREMAFHLLDANILAAGVVALLDAEARRRHLAVIGEPAARPLMLRGDRTLLEQVLINLVLNAMDATEALDATAAGAPARPPIALRVEANSHGGVTFRVVDAGVGIPVERLDHLFDSFHTSKAHGMGLGLSISRSIVEVHGGRIHAENNADGGATFLVTLPPAEQPRPGIADVKTA